MRRVHPWDLYNVHLMLIVCVGRIKRFAYPHSASNAQVLDVRVSTAPPVAEGLRH